METSLGETRPSTSSSARRATCRERIARFVPAAARILVTQPSPYVLFEPRTILTNNTFGGGRVLLRPHDRGIERHRPIDPASSVSLGLDHSQQYVPGPVGSETMMRLSPRLPRAEPLRKIMPRAAPCGNRPSRCWRSAGGLSCRRRGATPPSRHRADSSSTTALRSRPTARIRRCDPGERQRDRATHGHYRGRRARGARRACPCACTPGSTRGSTCWTVS